MALHAEPLRDSRCRYAQLTALLYGPLVLAGLTESTRLESELHGRADALPETLVPVPAAARQQLVSLHAIGRGLLRHDEEGRLRLMPLRDPGFATRRRGG